MISRKTAPTYVANKLGEILPIRDRSFEKLLIPCKFVYWNIKEAQRSGIKKTLEKFSGFSWFFHFTAI